MLRRPMTNPMILGWRGAEVDKILRLRGFSGRRGHPAGRDRIHGQKPHTRRRSGLIANKKGPDWDKTLWNEDDRPGRRQRSGSGACGTAGGEPAWSPDQDRKGQSGTAANTADWPYSQGQVYRCAGFKNVRHGRSYTLVGGPRRFSSALKSATPTLSAADPVGR